MTKSQYEKLKQKLADGTLKPENVAQAKEMVADYEVKQARKANSEVTTIFEEGTFGDNFGKSGVGFAKDMGMMIPNMLGMYGDLQKDGTRWWRSNVDGLFNEKRLVGNEITDGGDPYIWDGAADAAGDYLGARYGSVDAIQDTAYNDPFGVAADVGTVGMGPIAAGRGLTRAAGTGTNWFGRTGRQAGETLERAGTLMEALDPYALTLNAIGRPLHTAVNPYTKPGEEFGQILYPVQPADIKSDIDKSNEFTANLLNRGYTPTTAGTNRAKFDKKVAANELNAAIEAAEQAGRDIPVYKLVESLRIKRDELLNGLGPDDAANSAIKQIDQAIDRLENLDSDVLTISSARKMRQEWEKNIPFQTAPSTADVPVAEGRRVVADTLRDEINGISDDIAGANRRYSDAENARRAAEEAKLIDTRSEMNPMFGGLQRFVAEATPIAFTGKTRFGRGAYNTRDYFDAVFNETASPIGRGRRVAQQYFGEEENYIPDGSQVTDPREENEQKTISESFFDVLFRRYWN